MGKETRHTGPELEVRWEPSERKLTYLDSSLGQPGSEEAAG